jgi:uncharacterized membrane protein required for colicin V production
VTWFDAVALLLIALIAWAESNRGFGRAVFDVVGAIVALRVSAYLAGPLSTAVPLSGSDGASEALWLGLTFLLLVTLVVIASRFLYETTLLSLDVFDPLVGGILGAVSGTLAAHVLLKALLLTYGDSEAADALLGSFVGQEFIKLRTFHVVFNALSNLGK